MKLENRIDNKIDSMVFLLASELSQIWHQHCSKDAGSSSGIETLQWWRWLGIGNGNSRIKSNGDSGKKLQRIEIISMAHHAESRGIQSNDVVMSCSIDKLEILLWWYPYFSCSKANMVLQSLMLICMFHPRCHSVYRSRPLD